MNTTQYYLDIFKITPQELDTVIKAALSRGGDFADLYFEYTTFFNLLLKDGVVSSGGFHTDFGVGIRVLKGEKTGFAYSENTQLGDMIYAAKAASAIACSCSDSVKYTPVHDNKISTYPTLKSWRNEGADSFLPFLKSLETKVLMREIFTLHR